MRAVSSDGRPLDFLESFKGVGLNHFYLAVLRVLQGTFDARHQALLPDQIAVWVRPYLEAMEDFPERLLSRARYRFSTLLASLMIAVCLGIVAGAGWQYLATARSVIDLQSAVDVVSLADDTRAAEWPVPDALSPRLKLVGSKLTLTGVMSDAEFAELKASGAPQPVAYAALEASRQNRAAQAVMSEKNQRLQRLYLLVAMMGIGAVGAVLYFARLTQRRKRLLEHVVATRTDTRKMTELLRAMLDKEGGKPQLTWLRDEFRSANPLLMDFST